MKIDDLPLLALFNRLRRAGLPLGLPEYQLVLEALASGFGVPDRAALARLCSTLWVKSEDDQRLFDYHFAAVMAADETAFEQRVGGRAIAPDALSKETASTATKHATKKGPLRVWWQKTSRLTRFAIGGTAVLGLGLAVWITRPARQCPTFVSVPQTLVNRGEEYFYNLEIAPCENSSKSDIEIVALQKHPWLELQKEPDGTTSLSGFTPTHDIRYSQTAVWNAMGEKVTNLDGREDIAGLFVLSDSKKLITPLFDQRMLLWDAEGRLLSDFNNLKNIQEISTSKKGRLLVTADAAAPSERLRVSRKLWDDQGQLIAELDIFPRIGAGSDVMFGPNERFFITLSPDRTAHLWNDKGGRVKTFEGAVNDLIGYMQFSQDGELIVSGSREEGVKVWRAQTLENVASFELEDELRSLLLLQNGQRIVTFFNNGIAQLWSIQGEKLAELGRVGGDDVPYFSDVNGRSGRASSEMLFSPDEQRVIVREADETAYLWDLEGNRLANLGKVDGKFLRSVSTRFHLEGQRFSILSDGKTQLWSKDGDLLADFGEISDEQGSFLWSEDGQIIVTRLTDGTAQLRDAQGSVLFDFDGAGSFEAIALSRNNEWIITRTAEKTAQLRTVQGDLIGDFNSRKDIESIRFVNDDAQRILLELTDGGAQLWNAQEKLISDFDNLANIQRVNAFNSEEQRFLTFSSENTVRLWDENGTLLAEFGKTEPDDGARLLEGGRFIVVDLPGNIVQIWNEQGHLVSEFEQVNHSNQGPLSPQSSYRVRRVATDDLNLSLLDNLQLLAVSKINSSVTLQATDRKTGQRTQQDFQMSSFDDPTGFSPRFIRWLIVSGLISTSLLFFGFPVLYLGTRWLSKRLEKMPSFPPLQKAKQVSQSAASVLSQSIVDEIQVAQSVLQAITPQSVTSQSVTPQLIAQSGRQYSETPAGELTQSREYFPVTSRQMQQSWRYLRRLTREGPPVELDVQATVEQASRSGLLLKPVLRSRRVNRNELLLLVDQEGSMVPFHGLSERLVDTAVNGGRLAQMGVRYFHNCPDDYLYLDPYHQVAESIELALGKLQPEFAGVLIFSDAGAARGGLNRTRLELTVAFLERLQQHVRYIAWLNPTPSHRWTGTAGEIAKRVPMFELSRQGLDSCIDVLRGKSVL